MNFERRFVCTVTASATAAFISTSLAGCGSGGSLADRAVGEPDGGDSSSDRPREGGNTKDGPTNDTSDAGRPRGARQVFVTSSLYTGDSFGRQGGLLGADALCQSAASAAKLDGEFRAWLSAYGENAISRIHSNGPWYLVAAEERVAATKSALASGSLENAIARDEFGEVIPAAIECVWTGTTADGTSGVSCNGWSYTSASGTTGEASSTDSRWTAAGESSCSESCRLYCFEQ